MTQRFLPSVIFSLITVFALFFFSVVSTAWSQTLTQKTSLDGTWRLAIDPDNVGRRDEWFRKARPDAVDARVPWILQEAFPGYHGVVWYWKEFTAPDRGEQPCRFLLRFEQVDYLAEVWLNGIKIGTHEGGETPFVFDVTEHLQPGAVNRLAVRVLNPTHEEIDGIVLNQTAKRCKVIPYYAGSAYNHGGITGSVSLDRVPGIYIDDLYVEARPEGGRVRFLVTVRNSTEKPSNGTVEFSIASARSGETIILQSRKNVFPSGDSVVRFETTLDHPRLWQPHDPYLYRGTVRLRAGDGLAPHETSTRFGFRDFRFTDGYFRLNGKRIYLKSTHTCNHYPIGMQFPHDPDLLRRDMINLKTMGFNMVRFIWGGATTTQLDLCDELGLMVYDESYAAWPIDESPNMGERFDFALSEVIRRDRNHPSVVIWGFLNEVKYNSYFLHAASRIPMVRQLDSSRMLFLNSGRWDLTAGIDHIEGIRYWGAPVGAEPWVAQNTSEEIVRAFDIHWLPGHVAIHPGPKHEISVVQWTAPETGTLNLQASFQGLSTSSPTTTDFRILHNGTVLYSSKINLDGLPNKAEVEKKVDIRQGDTIRVLVGDGNGNFGADTTGLELVLRLAGKTYDLSNDFPAESNPGGPWLFGYLSPDRPDRLIAYKVKSKQRFGTLSNPDMMEWEDVLEDTHPYQGVPHTEQTIRFLRSHGSDPYHDGKPMFLSEYGIGSAVDLIRTLRFYERNGASNLEDARYFQDVFRQFQTDWDRWKMSKMYARQEDLFADSIARMASQRTLGINAVRANPVIPGHSVTGGIDHVMTGEGLTTTFREMKPGTIDAMYDLWSPVRWSLFAEPFHLYRGGPVRLEAVLVDEDVLKPGAYPVRLEILDKNNQRVFASEIEVVVPEKIEGKEEPFSRPVFDKMIPMDVPEGKYRFTATFLEGAAAAGSDIEFYVTDQANMPKVDRKVVLWGDDPMLEQWLRTAGIDVMPYDSKSAIGKDAVILAGSKPPAPGGKPVFDELARRIEGGATVVFLCPEIFADGEDRTAFMPLENKGEINDVWSWLYLTDQWAQRHPFFEGMPTGSLMDYTYYAGIISQTLFMNRDAPKEAVAGGMRLSQGYVAGLFLATYRKGEGSLVLNSFHIRQNLGKHPAAERLLRNLLLFAQGPDL